MADKRKDCRGRVLRTGESQRKDGRYVYKYLDEAGRQQFLYSWRLDERDKTPGGKPIEPSLRDKVKRLRADMEEGIQSSGGDMTVCDLVQKYVRQKTGVRHNTEANYNFVLNIIKKEPFEGFSSASARNTTAYTERRFPKSPHTSAATPIAPIWQRAE